MFYKTTKFRFTKVFMCFSYELLWLTCVRLLAFSLNLITID